MQLTTVGRKTGKERNAILGYYEDGPNLVTMAMNGWGAAEPAWWLNLQAQPDVTVELKTGTRAVRSSRPGRGAGAPVGEVARIRRRCRRLRHPPSIRDGGRGPGTAG
jgi:deazaflavin-dependent oxidoreductase (nitroreductase family)